MHHQTRANEILVILRDKSKNAFHVASEMTWDIDCESWEQFPLAQQWFATGETIAHLSYLEEEGKIHRKREGDIITYTLNHGYSYKEK